MINFKIKLYLYFSFLGRVAINTEQGSEALTVHGNIQISGQVMQPSDARYVCLPFLHLFIFL